MDPDLPPVAADAVVNPETAVSGDHEGSAARTVRASGPGTDTAARPGRPRERARSRSLWSELPFLVLAALLVLLLLRSFVVESFYIPSSSMENTLHVGDRVLVNRLSYHLHPIHRGDVVVFNGLDSFTPETTVAPAKGVVAKTLRGVAGLFGLAPPGEKDFVKRVIGVPGDHVVCCDTNGDITVNGTPLDEPYVYPGDTPSDTPFDVTVPAGRLWVMGDHRSVSADSRSHLGEPGGGTVPSDKVIGRAFTRVWPLSRWGGIGEPATFRQPGLALPATGGTADVTASAALVAPLLLVRRRRWRR